MTPRAPQAAADRKKSIGKMNTLAIYKKYQAKYFILDWYYGRERYDRKRKLGGFVRKSGRIFPYFSNRIGGA